jgi:hypothetical protein
MLTAVGHGTATISVTVNGVTSTTPVVVQQPFSFTTPAVASPGSTITVTTALPAVGTKPLSNVSASLSLPDGWTAKATTPSTFATVKPGQTAQTTWAVTVPASAAPGLNQLTAIATYSDANGRGSVTQSGAVSLPYPSLPAAFNNAGISDDSSPGAANLDGGNTSYSAQALAAAGLTPGGSFTHDGLTFTWPDAQPATNDNIVAGGQTFALSGSGSTLGLVGTGDYGAVSGTGTITYTDGTTQQFTVGFADWWSNSASPGGDILATLPYINNPSGKETQRVSVYYAGIPLQQGKTVAYVTLPNIGATAAQGQPAMHVFAVSIG